MSYLTVSNCKGADVISSISLVFGHRIFVALCLLPIFLFITNYVFTIFDKDIYSIIRFGNKKKYYKELIKNVILFISTIFLITVIIVVTVENIINDYGYHIFYDENFHSGIVGILAGKLVNEFNVPIIVFSKNLSTGKLVGSARSIDSYHIKEALDRINAKHPLVAYGGHKQAAGLTIELANLEEFKIDFASDVNSIFNGNFPDKIF